MLDGPCLGKKKRLKTQKVHENTAYACKNMSKIGLPLKVCPSEKEINFQEKINVFNISFWIDDT